MRDLRELDYYRVNHPLVPESAYSVSGAFVLPTGGASVRVLATADAGWDHVSVSLKDRTPTWEEMELVKREFFKDDETAMQLHVPPSDHINIHPHCLHLWRPHVGSIPTPPAWMV